MKCAPSASTKYADGSSPGSTLCHSIRRWRSLGLVLSPRERTIGLERGPSINPSAKLIVLDTDKVLASHIELSTGVFLGDPVEFTACGGDSIEVDDSRRGSGVIAARHKACLVLASVSSGRLSDSGARIDGAGDLAPAVAINGTPCGQQPIASGPFTLELDLPPRAPAQTSLPTSLAVFITIDITASGTGGYGIASATLTASA